MMRRLRGIRSIHRRNLPKIRQAELRANILIA
jgi:hypothetical protein